MIPPIGILNAHESLIGILNAPGSLIGILIPPIGILKAHQSLIGILNAHESLIGILNGSGSLIGVLILQRYVIYCIIFISCFMLNTERARLRITITLVANRAWPRLEIEYQG